jgi:hypothetical protein
MIFFRKKSEKERVLEVLRVAEMCILDCACVAVTISPQCRDEILQPLGAAVRARRGYFSVVWKGRLRAWVNAEDSGQDTTEVCILPLHDPHAKFTLLSLLQLDVVTFTELLKRAITYAKLGVNLKNVFRIDVAPVEELKSRGVEGGVIVVYEKCGALVYEKSKLDPEQVKSMCWKSWRCLGSTWRQ